MKYPLRIAPPLLVACFAVGLYAQAQKAQQGSLSPEERDSQIRQLHKELDDIAARLTLLEGSTIKPFTHREPPAAAPAATPTDASAKGVPAPAVVAEATPTTTSTGTARSSTTATDSDEPTLTFFRGTTINFGFDGYYEYNFDKPIGGQNQLRAYDFSSNSFSINQASVVVEHLPVAEPGKRFGGRIDLQYGQATATLQGSAANELHPEVWRNLFQAYGSYLAPIGSGLQVDFGKWASSLGVEGNYTKDQINYSRSYLFNYLPFYHTGLRANYNVTSKMSVAYWVVNGAQQTDDFNGFKSQAFIATLKPAKTISWNVNYYFGQEQRHSTIAAPTGAHQPATPNGREHIFDTYATWTATPKLTFVGEADFVVDRVDARSQPARVVAGTAYARYQLPRSYALAARAEYLDDRGGLFSNTTQALKEVTATFEHQFDPGFLLRAEYRRDFSNQHYFLTTSEDVLNTAQGTATLGLVYWWGTKQGAW